MQKQHQNVNLGDKKPKDNVQKAEKQNFKWKKSKHSLKKIYKCKFRWQKVTWKMHEVKKLTGKNHNIVKKDTKM